ncbi:hypothetical protein [Kribbella speibonae]|uniref:hypothetical protein n=1 Tax=Kribbella speibonae TaxID=1572660 RepID=UPI001EDFAB8E|nr:hypothetical protein [Kribbella speibonae]
MHLLVRRLTRLTVRRAGLWALRTLGTAVLRAALLRGTVLLALLRSALLWAAVLLALLRSTVLRAAVLLALLRVTLLALVRALGTALLGPEVLPLRVLTLRRTVLRLLTAGTWVRGWLVLVGHMLPRWLRWPHRRTYKG